MRLARWLVAPVLLALLAACGSTGSPAPTPTPPPNNGGGGTTPPPPAPNPQPTSITVVFSGIKVVHDCDYGTGQGEFFYYFRVNGTTIASRDESNVVGANDGDFISVNKAYNLQLYPTNTLTIDLGVFESDYPAAPTTVGVASKTFTSSENWGVNRVGEAWTVNLYNSTTCEVIGYYVISSP